MNRRDREAILARRALFVASALSGFVSSRALAAEACPDKAPSPAEIAAARQLFDQATERSKAGDFAGALEHLEQAQLLAPHPKLLLSIARVALELEDFAHAYTRARLALRCDEAELGAARESAEQLMKETEPAIARLVITTTPEGAEIELDGELVGTTPLAEPAITNGGRHTITARWPSSGAAISRSFEVSVGAQQSIEIEAPLDECLREPCVCLQPCLEPPLTLRRARFGVGLGYEAFIDSLDDDVENTGHGLNARGFYQLPFGDKAMLELGLGVTPSLIPDGTLIPVGAEIALLMTPRPFVVGLELSAGYVFADGAVVRSSPFVGTELVLGFALSEQVVVGARAGPFLSVHEHDGGTAFGPGYFTAGAFLSYAFGRACHEDGYPVRCEQPDYEAASQHRPAVHPGATTLH